MGRVDRDKFDFSGYDDKQIAMAFQGDKFDKEDYARLTGGSDTPEPETPEPTEPETITPQTPQTSPVNTGTTGGGNDNFDAAEDLKNDYVGSIIKNNVARDTGDIDIAGSNYGTANTGVMDYSVNIAGGGDGDEGMSNFASAAAGTALNENQYERSRSKMTGVGRAAMASDAAEDIVGAKDRVRGLDTSTGSMSTYYRELAKKQNIMAFGDYMSPYYQAPKFVAPEPPEPIKVNYDGE